MTTSAGCKTKRPLTFLYRAPRLDTKPLTTLGCPFAFQVFGYFAWQNDTLNEQAISECKQYLDDYAYEKIWSELSQGDREVARAIAEAPSSRVRAVREVAQMSTNQFNPYRDRLVKKGVVDGSTYGHVSFALPLFDRSVMEHS